MTFQDDGFNFTEDAAGFVADQEQQEWYRSGLKKVDAAALDPAKAYPDGDFSWDADPDRARMLVTNADYLTLHSGGREVPFDDTDVQRGMLRAEVAQTRFQGRGAESEEAFHAEVVKDATKRKDTRTRQAAIVAAATDDFLMPPGASPGFRAVRMGLKARPDYDPANEPDDAALFAEARAAAAVKLEPIRDELNAVWDAAVKKQPIPREALLAVPDDQWNDFLNAFRLRAQTLPDTERESFLQGASKDFARSLEGFGRNAAETIADVGMRQESIESGPYNTQLRQERAATLEAMTKGKNRAHEARRIVNAEYDPIDYVEGLGWLQKAPGVTVTSLSMAIPGVGQPLMAASLMGAAQEKTYLDLRDSGLNEADAGMISNSLAPVMMMPQVALENIGFGAWGRKIPWMNKAIDAVGDRIANRAARLLVKGGVITGIEGTTEVLQDFTEDVVMDLAAEFSPHVPDVDLAAEFRGAWRQFPEIAGSMIFLSLFGAAGGLNAEARAAAWAQSTPRQMAAVGITPEAIERIEAAKARGPSSLMAEVTNAWETRNANSPEAAAAAKEEAAAVRAQQQAAQRLSRSGYMPDIVGNARDGYAVYDGETKDEIGRSPDREGALRIASAHSAALDERNAERVAYMADLMEGGEAVLELAGDADAMNSLETGTFYTEATAAAESPASIDQFASQAADRETMDGGTGDVTRIALGRNVAETRGMVRTFTNRLFQGSSIRTLVHETGHGMLRRSWDAGTITREETLEMVQAVNAAMQGRTQRKGAYAGYSLALIDQAKYDAADAAGQDRILHEAVAEIMEAEVMRTRKRDKSGKALPLDKGIVTRGVFSAAKFYLKQSNPKLAGKFTALVEAVRGIVGLSVPRALMMKKAIREGTLDEAMMEGFLTKLTGRDLQAEHDGMVRDEAAQLAGVEAFTPTEDAPFSIGRAETSVFAEASKPMSTTQPRIGAFSREIGMTFGNGWNSERGMSNNAAWAIDEGKMPAPEFKEWLADLLGVQSIPMAAVSAGNGAAGNIFKEYHHMGRTRAEVDFYDPSSIEKSPKFFLGMAKYFDTLKTGKRSAAASRKQALQAWKNLKQALIEDGKMGDWKGSETKEVRNQSTRMEALPLNYRTAVSEGRMSIDEAEVKAFTDATAALEKEAATLKAAVDKRQSQIAKWTKKIEAGEKPPYDGYLGNQESGLAADAEKLAAVVEQLQKRTPPQSAEAGRKMSEDRASSVAGFESRQSLGPQDGLLEGSDASGFSLAPASMVESMSMNVAARIKDPVVKMGMFERMLTKLGDLKRDKDEIGVAFGKPYTRESIESSRKADLRKKANAIKRKRYAELKTGPNDAEAKAQAEAEAEEWFEKKLAARDQDYSPMARLLRALAMLDAILAVLPPEVRGRVGGHTRLAKLPTDEKRLEFLNARIEKVEEELDTYLGKEYRKLLDKLIESSKPKKDKAGKKRSGHLGPEAHRYFERVKAALDMDEDALKLALAHVDEKLAEETDPEALSDLAEEWQILRGYGNFDEKNVLEKHDAVQRAQQVFDTGKNAWRMQEEARLQDVRDAAATTKAEAGGGDVRDLQQTKADGRTAIAALTEKHWNLRSFREVLDLAFGEGSATAKRFGNAARRGFTARTKAMIGLQREWKNAMESATGKKGREARQVVYDMQAVQSIEELVSPEIYEETKIPVDTFFDAEKKASLGLSPEEVATLTEQFENLPEGSRRKYLRLERQVKTGAGAARMVKFTEAEAVHLTMLWAQAGYKDALRKHGFGADFQAAIEEQLSPAAKALRQWLADYYRDNFPRLAALYRKMYGVDLRQTENYAPGTFWHTGTNETPVDPSAGVVTGGNFKAGLGSGGDFAQGFLKQRKKHKAVPRITNAFDLFFSHANQSEHWLSMAELSREMHGVFGQPDVKIAMEVRSPAAANALREWLKAIDSNGVQMAASGKLMRYLLESQAYMAMAWKASTAAKNLIGSALNQAYGIPMHEYARGIAALVGGRLEFGEMFKSDAIQNKLHGGYAPEVRAAVTQALTGKPNLRGDLLIQGLEIHGKADAFGNAIGATIAFDYHFRQGMKEGLSEKQARTVAMELTVDSIARLSQPAEIIDRSLVELNLGAFGKLMFLFRSEARQKSSLYLTALGHTVTFKPTRKDLRVLVISHLIMAPLMRAMTSAFADALDPDDDEWLDEKYWNPRDFLISALTGPLSGIPLLGDVFSGFQGSNNPLATYYRAGEALVDLFKDDPKGDELEWYEAKINKILHGIGAFPGVAANLYKQAAGAVRNLTD